MKLVTILVLFFTSTLVYADLIDASKVDLKRVIEWSEQRVESAKSNFLALGKKYYGSPNFWGNQTIYQIQVDRFNNGDLTNDDFNIEEAQRTYQQGPDLFGLPDYRHGGDLRGIIDRLDYIKDMGMTTLWLTPVFKHNGSYHGYCTTDFTEIDPGFGTKEELKELVAQAHQRGIKVVLDIVVNHMCNQQTRYANQPDHYRCAEDLSRKNWSAEGGASSAAGELSFGADFFPPFKSQFFFNRCGANSIQDMQGTGPAAIYGDFVSVMFDFDTRNRDFQKIFTNLHKYWIAYADIDGYRMDAAKHITEDFIAYFNTHIRAFARDLGKHNFYIVGEVAGPSDWIGRRLGKMFSNPANPNDRGHVPQSLTNMLWQLKDIYLQNPTAPYAGLNGAYDFAHGGTAVDVLLGNRATKAIEDHFQGTYFNDIAAQNDYRLSWNLLEIHDWPRFSSRAKHDVYKSMLGISYLATAEGMPIIYYGQEQGFNGDCHFHNMNAGEANGDIQKECQGHSHALYRQDMFQSGPFRLGSTVKEINDMAYIGKIQKKPSPSWTEDPYLNRDHVLYRLTRKMFHIRKSCNALSFGTTKIRWSDHNGGLLAFSRIDGGNEALVVVNTSIHEFALPEMGIENFSQGEKWVNLLNANEVGYTTGRGKLNFAGLTIKANSVMVLVHYSQVSDYNTYLETHLCKDSL